MPAGDLSGILLFDVEPLVLHFGLRRTVSHRCLLQLERNFSLRFARRRGRERRLSKRVDFRLLGLGLGRERGAHD